LQQGFFLKLSLPLLLFFPYFSRIFITTETPLEWFFLILTPSLSLPSSGPLIFLRTLPLLDCSSSDLFCFRFWVRFLFQESLSPLPKFLPLWVLRFSVIDFFSLSCAGRARFWTFWFVFTELFFVTLLDLLPLFSTLYFPLCQYGFLRAFFDPSVAQLI